MAWRLPPFYWSAAGAVQDKTPRRAKPMQSAVALKRPLTNFLSPRQRLTFTHAEFFAVCHAAVAKLSFLITGPPHTSLCKGRLEAGLDRGVGFLGGLSMSVAAATNLDGPIPQEKGRRNAGDGPNLDLR